MAQCPDDTPQKLAVLIKEGDADAVAYTLNDVRRYFTNRSEANHEIKQAILSCEHGGRNSKSAMHCAATLGRSEILKVLLAYQVDVNSTDDTGNTPLHFAADLGQARAARVLCDAAANPLAINNFGQKPVDKSQSNSWDSEKIKAGKYWIRRMFEGELDTWDSLPPDVIPAARSAPTPADSSTRGSTGFWAGATVCGAAMSSPPMPVPDAADHISIDPFVPMEKEDHAQTPYPFFGAAASNLRSALGRMAMPTKGESGVVDIDGCSSSSISAVPNYAFFDPPTPAPDTVQPFSSAGQALLKNLIKKDDASGVQAFLANVQRITDGPTEYKRKQLIRSITSCEEGEQDARVVQSGLHFAALQGKVRILEILLGTGCDVNIANDQGSTPLHLAVDCGQHSAVQFLLNAKANPFLKNNFGRTPHEVREGRNSLVSVGETEMEIDARLISILRSTVEFVKQGGVSEDCSICQETIREGEKLRALPCLHKYHSSCLCQWLRRSLTCPTCKLALSAVVDEGYR